MFSSIWFCANQKKKRGNIKIFFALQYFKDLKSPTNPLIAWPFLCLCELILLMCEGYYYFQMPELIYTTATASAANKNGSLKAKWQWWAGITRYSLAKENYYCHRASLCFPSVSDSPMPFYLGWATFKTGSLEVVVVAALWFKDPAQIAIAIIVLHFTYLITLFIVFLKKCPN